MIELQDTVLDIMSKAEQPLNILSNFHPNEFELDGIQCASMEGFLQSLKTNDPDEQIRVCALNGATAKLYFAHTWKNLRWKLTGVLCWKGQKIKRTSRAYELLLDRAYAALAENPQFAAALLATGDAVLVHSIGKHNRRLTVLTEAEFVSRLMNIRDELRRSGRIVPRL